MYDVKGRAKEIQWPNLRHSSQYTRVPQLLIICIALTTVRSTSLKGWREPRFATSRRDFVEPKFGAEARGICLP